MAQIKRETAMICLVDDLLRGSFVKTEGWNPSYMATDLGNISRVNVMGVVVSKEPAGGVILDDGSGRILLRSFEGDLFSYVDAGDLVMVIGRPRVYNEQKYVLPEIIRKINPKWSAFRQLQLEILKKKAKPLKKEARMVVEEEHGVNYSQKIMEFIRDLDAGSGADIEEVIKRSGAPNAEELVRKLIEEGEIFELKPGKLKVL
jgi:RPA family protein